MRLIMNSKKHIFLLYVIFSLLSFPLICFAMEQTHSTNTDKAYQDYLNKVRPYLNENGNFKSEGDYLLWMNKQNEGQQDVKPKIVIVGSGRGTVSGEKIYAKFAYPSKEYDYLLVNYTENPEGYGKGTQPDIDSDIRKIDTTLKFSTYDVCIFENVDFSASFSRLAIIGAINILKPGGILVTSVYPVFSPLYTEKIFNKIKESFPNSFELTDGFSIAFNEAGEIRMYLSGKSQPNGFSEQEYLNKNGKNFITFLGIQTKCDYIEFKDITVPNNLFWPSKSEIRNKLGETYQKSVLILGKSKN